MTTAAGGNRGRPSGPPRQVSTVLGTVSHHLFDSPSVKPSCLSSTTKDPIPCDSKDSEETKIKPKKIRRNVSLAELLPTTPRQKHFFGVCTLQFDLVRSYLLHGCFSIRPLVDLSSRGRRLNKHILEIFLIIRVGLKIFSS